MKYPVTMKACIMSEIARMNEMRRLEIPLVWKHGQIWRQNWIICQA